MKKQSLILITTWISLFMILLLSFIACNKNVPDDGVNTAPYYNLDVTLLPGTTKADFVEHAAGFLKFRQDPDTARIVTLDTWVFNLLPNHSYSLQRAVDPIASASCVSTTWLTLGEGLVPQTINTDAKGNGHEELFRDLTAAARGTQFRIHFQIIDAATGETVLTSDCFQFTVR
jgi:hypothetical protein